MEINLMPCLQLLKIKKRLRRSSSIMIFNFCLFCWKGIRSERITVWFMLHLWAIKLNACDIVICFNPEKISQRASGSERIVCTIFAWCFFSEKSFTKWSRSLGFIRAVQREIKGERNKYSISQVKKQTSHILRFNKSASRTNFFVFSMKNYLICSEIIFHVYEKRKNMTEWKDDSTLWNGWK